MKENQEKRLKIMQSLSKSIKPCIFESCSGFSFIIYTMVRLFTIGNDTGFFWIEESLHETCSKRLEFIKEDWRKSKDINDTVS